MLTPARMDRGLRRDTNWMSLMGSTNTYDRCSMGKILEVESSYGLTSHNSPSITPYTAPDSIAGNNIVEAVR